MLKNFLKKILKKEDELEYLIRNGLTVGKNFNIFSNSVIDSAWPWLITIGDNVTISSNVTILAHDASTNVVGCCTKLGKVRIGNNVFIGTGATILCNSRIGDNVIIGANSLVSGVIEDNSVYAGVPAKKIYTYEEFKTKNQKLLSGRPRFDKIRPWYDWKNATLKEKEDMKKQLDDGIGFI